MAPPAKRSKVPSQASSTSESEDESFDPTLERDDFKVKVPKMIEKYIDKHFRRSLSKKCTAMLKRHPKPDIEAAMPPKLDKFVADFAGKKLDEARDSQLAKIQGAMVYAACPLTNLWAELIEQGLANNPETAIEVTDILDIVQRTLVLENANSLISETRREIALESIHPSLKRYGKREFTKAKADLFGEEFKDKNIVSKILIQPTKYTRDQAATVFSAAGPVGMVLCPARCTSRTTDTKGKENDPQQALLQERQCVRQTWIKPV